MTSPLTDKQPTDLGTKEIHQRKKVMIEGGKLPRARVMDQLMIDKYLMDGLLTLAQHQAGEYILQQATMAGVYTRPLNMEGGGGTVNKAKPDNINDALIRFGRTMKIISNKFGTMASYIVEEVVCHNMDVSRNGEKMRVLKDGLDLIVNARMAGGRNPMRHLKK